MRTLVGDRLPFLMHTDVMIAFKRTRLNYLTRFQSDGLILVLCLFRRDSFPYISVYLRFYNYYKRHLKKQSKFTRREDSKEERDTEKFLQ